MRVHRSTRPERTATMKPLLFAFLALTALPRVVSQENSALQSITQMPQCARDCLIEVVPKSPCSFTDQKCLCENPTLLTQMQSCILGKCTIKESLVSQNITATTCDAPVRDKSNTYRIVSDTFGIVSAVFVLQRFLYKIWAKIDLGIDDWITLLTLLVGIPSTVLNTTCIAPNGVGRDIWTLKPNQITSFIRGFYFLEVMYFAEIAMLKLALLFFYIRIFPGRVVRRLLWGTVVVSALFGITFVVVSLLQCRPLSYYWLMWDGEHHGTCLDINAFAWSNAAFSISLDAWMLAIPLWQLGALKLDWKRKVGVAMMFCVGTFVTVVSIVRLQSLIKFGAESLNPTYDFFGVAIWSCIEINVGLICVCLPSFRLLLVRIFPRLQGTTQRYYARQASGGIQSGTNRRTSRPPVMGNTATTNVASSEFPRDVEPNRIGYQTTYTVEYAESDEVHLVHLKDIDRGSAKSDLS